MVCCIPSSIYLPLMPATVHDLAGARKAAEEMLQALEDWSEEELKYPS